MGFSLCRTMVGVFLACWVVVLAPNGLDCRWMPQGGCRVVHLPSTPARTAIAAFRACFADLEAVSRSSGISVFVPGWPCDEINCRGHLSALVVSMRDHAVDMS